MRQEFGMAVKFIAAQVERLFIDGRCRYRIKFARLTETNAGFDEIPRSSAILCAFLTHRDRVRRAGDVVEVVNTRFGETARYQFSGFDDPEFVRESKLRCPVCEIFFRSDEDRRARSLHLRMANRLK